MTIETATDVRPQPASEVVVAKPANSEEICNIDDETCQHEDCPHKESPKPKDDSDEEDQADEGPNLLEEGDK